MMEELAAEFSKTGRPATLEYRRIDVASYAASALVSGQDMILTIGRLGDKELASAKDGWKKLAPTEHALGARALAIVVHERNIVESLTLEQVQRIFASPPAAEWKLYGGEAKAIHRYGLPQTDPLGVLFHEKVLPSGRCGTMVRKDRSADVLTVLASDPQAIAFVDAVAASAAGGAIKTVAIGDLKACVLPNAQTIKDGTYPLAQALMLYVSPKAAKPTQDFAQFILAGKGDAVCRKHGFLPTLRMVRADAIAAFQKLYGAEMKRVKATADPNDDIALAGLILQSVRNTKLNEDLVATMCEAAFDLAFNTAGGETAAFEAIAVWGEKAPDMLCDCALKRAALYERAFKADKLSGDGARLVEALTAAGDLGTSAHRRPRRGHAPWP
jgi:phosphate transport system substrate-binding protein